MVAAKWQYIEAIGLGEKPFAQEGSGGAALNRQSPVMLDTGGA